VEEDLTRVDEKTHLWDVGEVDNKESIEIFQQGKNFSLSRQTRRTLDPNFSRQDVSI
jgi:hypothetical protein